MTIRDWIKEMTPRLAAGSDSAALDAQVLLAHVLGRPRAWLLAHPEAELEEAQQEALERAVSRLERGEALPHVLGQWEFYGMSFSLTPGPSPSGRGGNSDSPLPPGEGPGVRGNACPVLIPRPETELLVERALEWLKDHTTRRQACDVGTGSGCIAITLAAHIPGLHVLATDLSWEALEVARGNACRHGVEGRVEFVQADLLPPGEKRFDLVCANLPYIPSSTLRTLEVYGREPTLALDGGPDGLSLIRRLILAAPRRLLPGGLLLLEIEASQGPAVQALSRAAFPTARVRLLPDLAGRDRLVEISLPGEFLPTETHPS